MLNLSAEDVTEDEIEKTDTILAGLAYQFAIGDATHVTVFVSDATSEQTIDDVLTAVNVGDSTTIIEGRGFINDLIADQPAKRSERRSLKTCLTLDRLYYG